MTFRREYVEPLTLTALIVAIALAGCRATHSTFVPRPSTLPENMPEPITAITNQQGQVRRIILASNIQFQAILPTFRVTTLAADFEPHHAALTNLWAFIDAKTNLQSPWIRQYKPYPVEGGTLTVPFTNTGTIFYRAGYEFR